MNLQTPVKKSIQVEIPLNSATATSFSFPDIPYLRNKKITHIEVSRNTRSLNTLLFNFPTQDAIIPNSTAIFFTFQDKQGVNFIQNLPLIELEPTCQLQYTSPSDQISPNNPNGLFEIVSREIVFTKSFVFIPYTIGTNGPFCLLLNIFYKD
jgi:hypothetical protein